jgi:hypothetical protein
MEKVRIDTEVRNLDQLRAVISTGSTKSAVSSATCPGKSLTPANPQASAGGHRHPQHA